MELGVAEAVEVAAVDDVVAVGVAVIVVPGDEYLGGKVLKVLGLAKKVDVTNVPGLEVTQNCFVG